MMTATEMRGHVFAEPFRSFRIHMTSGRVFEVRHPEVVQLGRYTLTLFTPLTDLPEARGLWHKLSLVLIESIEPLDAPLRSRVPEGNTGHAT